MKKLVRKGSTSRLYKSGFSMIELLFVMVILASLSAIAIPNMNSGSESSILTSMRSDAHNSIDLLQAQYIEEQDYYNIIAVGGYTDGENNDGKSTETLLDDKTTLTVSKNNTIKLDIRDCDTGYGNGFYIQVTNSQIAKTVYFDSCIHGVIQIGTPETTGYTLPEGHTAVESDNIFLEQMEIGGETEVFVTFFDPDTGQDQYKSLGGEKSMSDYNTENFSIGEGGFGDFYYEGEAL